MFNTLKAANSYENLHAVNCSWSVTITKEILLQDFSRNSEASASEFLESLSCMLHTYWCIQQVETQ